MYYLGKFLVLIVTSFNFLKMVVLLIPIDWTKI